MNIFIRAQDNDLFKYLSDQELAGILPLCEKRSLKAGEVIPAQDATAVLIVQSGKLIRHFADGKKIGTVYPGEIELEAGLFSLAMPRYYLKSGGHCEILLCPYSVLESLSSASVRARIQAAINDSLCFKLAQSTHRNHDEDNE
jgi:hypothetical protein